VRWLLQEKGVTGAETLLDSEATVDPYVPPAPDPWDRRHLTKSEKNCDLRHNPIANVPLK
jgi:hypothetical protein